MNDFEQFCKVQSFPYIHLKTIQSISDNDEKSPEYQLSGCYCFVTKTLIMESSGVLPRINSSRIAFATVILASMMIYFYWEAMLISYLAVRKPKLPFTTLEELSENSNYKVGRKITI